MLLTVAELMAEMVWLLTKPVTVNAVGTMVVVPLYSPLIVTPNSAGVMLTLLVAAL